MVVASVSWLVAGCGEVAQQHGYFSEYMGVTETFSVGKDTVIVHI